MDRDLALIDRLERLYPAVVADVLDGLGAREQVLDPGIRPLSAGSKVAGFASTVSCVPVGAVPASRDDWYRGEISAVDSQQPGDVMVVSTCSVLVLGRVARHRVALPRRTRHRRRLLCARHRATLIEMRYPTFAVGIALRL